LNCIPPLKGLFSKDKKLISFIKNVFGFSPGNILLYKLAFCHKSVSTEEINGSKINNERLEFLGDAVISTVIADYLFKKFPQKDEGFLTEMRSKIVSRDNLNKLSEKLGMHKFIQADSSNIYRSIKGDAFEAFIGAMFLDKGYKCVKKSIIKRIIKFHLDIDEIENTNLNFKSKLIEWAQREKKHLEFVLLNEEGKGYKKQYIVEVRIDNIPSGTGRDYSIKKAEQNAAEKTLATMDYNAPAT
jgi:ribonuclease III